MTTVTPSSKPDDTETARTHRAKRGEGELLREQILDATEGLILSKGDADKVSVRMVADAVGRTPPSIYLHFDTKDELIHAVCERRFDHLSELFTADLVGVEDPIDQIEVMARTYVRFAADNPEQYRVLFMSNTKHHEGDELAELTLVSCFSMLFEAVQRAMDTGRFVKGDAMLMSLSMWATVHGIASLWISHDMGESWPTLDEQVDQCIATNLRGLLVR